MVCDRHEGILEDRDGTAFLKYEGGVSLDCSMWLAKRVLDMPYYELLGFFCKNSENFAPVSEKVRVFREKTNHPYVDLNLTIPEEYEGFLSYVVKGGRQTLACAGSPLVKGRPVMALADALTSLSASLPEVVNRLHALHTSTASYILYHKAMFHGVPLGYDITNWR